MKITAIRAYQVDLPLHEGSYKWSGGNAVSVFDSTVVAVETDAGLTGWGEICPLGPAYLPAYARGARAGIAELAPQLLGADPIALGELNERMDSAMRGHPYVKSAIDMACWDLLGKASNLPVATLMGGHVGEDFALYRAISQESPAQMAKKIGKYRKEGYRKFQLKVGGDPDTDIDRIKAAAAVLQRGDVLIADANTGWTQHAAVRVADSMSPSTSSPSLLTLTALAGRSTGTCPSSISPSHRARSDASRIARSAATMRVTCGTVIPRFCATAEALGWLSQAQPPHLARRPRHQAPEAHVRLHRLVKPLGEDEPPTHPALVAPEPSGDLGVLSDHIVPLADVRAQVEEQRPRAIE